jgi:hypothetical protein
MIAIAGASLLASSQAFAQLSYSSGDLLLNMRNEAAINPVSGSDLEVNVGTVSSLEALPQGAELVTPTLVSATFGSTALNNGTIGLSASGVTSGSTGSSATLYLSRYDDTPGYSPADPVNGDSVESGQQAAGTQGQTFTRISNIGGLAGTSVTDSAYQTFAAETVSASTSGNSYQSQGEHGTSASGQAIIDFNTTQGTGANVGGTIENSQVSNVNANNSGDYNGNGGLGATVYEALWEVPPGNAGSTSDTYLGYLAFLTTGEVDYYSAVSAVPEPSTYGLLAGLGLAALALRRQVRSMIA